MKKDEPRWLFSPDSRENSGQRTRESFLMSLVAHLLVVLWVALGPDLLPRPEPPEPGDRDKAKRLGFLALPRDYETALEAPPAVRPKVPEKERMLRPPPPKVNPRALQVPEPDPGLKQAEKPETAAPSEPPDPEPGPSVARPSKPLPPEPQPPLREEADGQAGARRPKETGTIESTSPFVAAPEESDIKSNLKDLYAGLRLPGGTAPGSEVGRGIGSRQSRGGGGDSRAGADFGRRQPDFSVERPTILSDTQGVDFGPWLTAVYFRVRNNWYSVIPQVYRSGLKGVVVIVFDVRRNGSLEDLEVVRSSNFSPYDRAAISSLKLSEPLPNFPDAFKKDRLTLQFTYLYNIRL